MSLFSNFNNNEEDICSAVKMQNTSNPPEPMLNAINDIMDYLNSGVKIWDKPKQFQFSLITALAQASSATFIQGMTSKENHLRNMHLIDLQLRQKTTNQDIVNKAKEDTLKFFKRYDNKITKELLAFGLALASKYVEDGSIPDKRIPYVLYTRLPSLG